MKQSFGNNKKKLYRLLMIAAVFVAFLSFVVTAVAASIENEQHRDIITSDNLQAEKSSEILATLGLEQLGQTIVLPTANSTDVAKWGYQSSSGASVAYQTGGEGGIGVNSNESGNIIIFGKIRLSEELIDLRQSGALKVDISARFGTAPRRDTGSLGVGKAGLTDASITRVSDCIGTYVGERGHDLIPGWGLSWNWDGVNAENITPDSSGSDETDEILYVMLCVKSNGDYSFTFNNVALTLNYTGAHSVFLKKSAAGILGGKPTLPVGGVFSGKNTDAPTGSVYQNSTALTYQTAEDYFTLRAEELVGFVFLGWRSSSVDETVTFPDDHAGRSIEELRNSVGGVFSTDGTIRISMYARTGMFQFFKNTYLTALYAPIVYETEFRMGEGTSGAMSNQLLPYGAAVALSENRFQKENNSFKNWITEDGRTFADRQTVSNLIWHGGNSPKNKEGYLLADASALVLTAQWSNYSMGGGEDGDAASFNAVNVLPNGDYFSIQYDVTRKDGNTGNYTLVGVYARYSSHQNADFIGTIVALDYQDGYWYLPYATGTYTLSSEWVPNSYTITYVYDGWNTDGAEMNAAPKSFFAGMGPSADELPVNLTAAGKTFAGWLFNGVVIKGNDLLKINQNLVLTAAGLKDKENKDRAYVDSITASADSVNAVSASDSADKWPIGGSEASKTGDWYLKPITVRDGKYSGFGDYLANGNRGDQVQFSMAFRFVALQGEALKAFLMGEEVRIRFSATSQVGAYANFFAQREAHARGQVGVAQGYTWKKPGEANGDKTSPNACDNGSEFSYVASSWSSWQYKNVDLTSNTLTLSSAGQPGFTLELYTKVRIYPNANYYEAYSGFTNMSYTVSFGGKTLRYEVGFDGNGGVRADSASSASETIRVAAESGINANIIAPENLYERTGYRFIGWSADASATASSVRIQPGNSITVSGNATYYAVWEKKKYTVVVFDELRGDDDSDRFRMVRTTLLREFGTEFDFTAAYRPYAGQTPEYTLGFTKSEEKIPSILAADNTLTTDLNAGVVVWTLNASDAEIADAPTVDYGTTVDLEDLVAFRHDAEGAATEITRWDYAAGGTGEGKFALRYGVVANVDESLYMGRQYFFTAKTTVNVYGVTIARTKKYEDSKTVSATVKPVVVEAVNTGAEVMYNGELQKFPLSFRVYQTSYAETDRYENALKVFQAEFESDTSFFGLRNRGVKLGAPTLTYVSRLGAEFAPDEGFRHAGTYYIQSVMLVETSGTPNRNYIWSEIHTDDEQTLTGVDISAEILPAKLDFIYFFTQKTYNGTGGADPSKRIVNDYPENGTFPNDGKNGWYFQISGMKGLDFERNADAIREYALKRAEGQDVKATTVGDSYVYGGYDVYLDESALERSLKNNYDFTYHQKDRETDDYLTLTEKDEQGNTPAKEYFVITHKVASIEWSPVVGDDGYTYFGGKLGVRATVFGIVEGEILTFVNGTDEGAGTVENGKNTFDITRVDAGTYEVSASIAGVTTGEGSEASSGNYILIDADTSFTILKRTVSVKFSDETSFTYDNTP